LNKTEDIIYLWIRETLLAESKAFQSPYCSLLLLRYCAVLLFWIEVCPLDRNLIKEKREKILLGHIGNEW
jgi:hypothetical protein